MKLIDAELAASFQKEIATLRAQLAELEGVNRRFRGALRQIIECSPCVHEHTAYLPYAIATQAVDYVCWKEGETLPDSEDIDKKYNDGYAAAIAFISNEYQTLGHSKIAAEVMNMHTPATAVQCRERRELLEWNEKLSDRLKEMEKERDAWKANHEDMKYRNAFLTQRPI